MSFWKWSRTAANNATADGSINWAEGQAPSTVNDSARAMMAAASKYRDDVAGAIATAGTAPLIRCPPSRCSTPSRTWMAP